MVRHLIKRGLLSKYENDPVPDTIEEISLFDSITGSSVLGRIGTGENQGSKVRRVGSFGTESDSGTQLNSDTTSPEVANIVSQLEQCSH